MQRDCRIVMNAGTEDFSFVVFGDPQNVNETCKGIVAKVIKEQPDFCVIVGDMVNDAGDEAQWSRISELVKPLREQCPLYVIPGNHDYQLDGNADKFLSFAKSPGGKTYFSIESKDICFLFLDSVSDAMRLCEPDVAEERRLERGGCDPNGEQYSWLVGHLERAKNGNKKTVLFHHHPIFLPTNVYFCTSSTIKVDQTKSPPTLGVLLPLLIRHPPEIVFSGHLHTYERCSYSGIDFVTTGASSYDLWKMEGTVNSFRVIAEEKYHYCRVDVSPSGISVRVIDEDGIEIDSWQRS